MPYSGVCCRAKCTCNRRYLLAQAALPVTVSAYAKTLRAARRPPPLCPFRRPLLALSAKQARANSPRVSAPTHVLRLPVFLPTSQSRAAPFKSRSFASPSPFFALALRSIFVFPESFLPSRTESRTGAIAESERVSFPINQRIEQSVGESEEDAAREEAVMRCVGKRHDRARFGPTRVAGDPNFVEDNPV
jgi:hypothetical protein